MRPVHEVKSLNTFLNRVCQSEEEVNEVLGGDLTPDVGNGGEVVQVSVTELCVI